MRYTFATHYSLIWINVDVKWLLLEQFELKNQKYFWQACYKSYSLFCCGGVSGNNLPPGVVWKQIQNYSIYAARQLRVYMDV